MSRRKRKNQKERDKRGKDRMEKFDEKVKDEPVVKAIAKISTDEYEEYTVTGYQKIDPGEWEKIEISYKRKKR